MKIAIITTVYNRKEKTIQAITSLIKKSANYEIKFFICDDGSTDGTASALSLLPAQIEIIPGSGNLFWSRGIYAAMQAALKWEPEFYLMINDDVLFVDDAIGIMLRSYRLAGTTCGIVGSTKNADGLISYGGRRLQDQSLIVPNGSIQECELTNWNCFLIDRNIVQHVGLIDNYYEHGLGDFDYSLRMTNAGYKVYVATDYIGYCETNLQTGTYHDKNVCRAKRFQSMFSRRNMPIKSRWHYYYKNFKFRGIKGFLWPYIKCSYCILRKIDY